jgi:hypothetical protein
MKKCMSFVKTLKQFRASWMNCTEHLDLKEEPRNNFVGRTCYVATMGCPNYIPQISLRNTGSSRFTQFCFALFHFNGT